MKTTPLKSIRAKCLDCMGFQSRLVKECNAEDCPLFPYRLGKDPARRGIGRISNVVKEKAHTGGGILAKTHR